MSQPSQNPKPVAVVRFDVPLHSLKRLINKHRLGSLQSFHPEPCPRPTSTTNHSSTFYLQDKTRLSAFQRRDSTSTGACLQPPVSNYAVQHRTISSDGKVLILAKFCQRRRVSSRMSTCLTTLSSESLRKMPSPWASVRGSLSNTLSSRCWIQGSTVVHKTSPRTLLPSRSIY